MNPQKILDQVLARFPVLQCACHDSLNLCTCSVVKPSACKLAFVLIRRIPLCRYPKEICVQVCRSHDEFLRYLTSPIDIKKSAPSGNTKVVPSFPRCAVAFNSTLGFCMPMIPTGPGPALTCEKTPTICKVVKAAVASLFVGDAMGQLVTLLTADREGP